MWKTVRARFELTDMLIIGFHAVMIVLLLPGYDEIPDWSAAMTQSLLIIGATVFVALKLDPTNYKAASVARFGLCLGSTILGYERARAMIHMAWGKPSIETFFVEADQLLFGGNPSEWMQAIHHPLLTEYLQVSYLAYFLLPLIVAIFLMGSGRWRSLPVFFFATIFATHLNFVFYMLVPVRSPFLIADTAELGHLVNYDFALSGIWFTESLRSSLLDSTTMRYDCFPSGHTCLTTVTLFMAWRLHRTAFWVILPTGLSLIFSTIYLRYHYLVDVIAGLGMAWFIIRMSPVWVKAWSRERQPGLLPAPEEQLEPAR